MMKSIKNIPIVIGLIILAICTFYLSGFFANIVCSFVIGVKVGLTGGDAALFANPETITALYSNSNALITMNIFADFWMLTCLVGGVALFSMIPGSPSFKENLSIKPFHPAFHAIIVVIAGIFINQLIDILWNFIPFSEQVLREYDERVGFLGENSFPIFILTVIAAPIVEEILCRGIIQKQLNRILPKFVSVVISSAIFGFLHGNIYQGTYAFLIGLILGYIFERYDSIFMNMLFHAGFNSASYIYEGVVRLTGETVGSIILFGFAIISIPLCVYIVVSGIREKRKENNIDNIEASS